MRSRFTFWYSRSSGPPDKVGLCGPHWISAQGPVDANDLDGGEFGTGVLLVPGAVGGRACVAMVVPEYPGGAVSVNYRPIPPGIHELGHTDRVRFGELTLWVAEIRHAEVVAYDPAVHGEGQRCLRTKSRLRPQDRIVCCPRCRSIYSERAFALGRPCEVCAHDPNERDWEPPANGRNGSGLAELLELVGERA